MTVSRVGMGTVCVSILSSWSAGVLECVQTLGDSRTPNVQGIDRVRDISLS